jgi:hypothetical protein
VPNQTNPKIAVAANSSVLLLLNNSQFTTPGDVVRVSETSHTEIRRIGAFGALPLAAPAYADYPTGTLIESVKLDDDAAISDKFLAAGTVAAAGTTVLELDNRDGLVAGRVLRIGPVLGDPQREFIVIKQLPNPQPSPNAGKVILAAPLQHTGGASLFAGRAGSRIDTTYPVRFERVTPLRVSPRSQTNAAAVEVDGHRAFAERQIQRAQPIEPCRRFRCTAGSARPCGTLLPLLIAPSRRLLSRHFCEVPPDWGNGNGWGRVPLGALIGGLVRGTNDNGVVIPSRSDPSCRAASKTTR